MSNSMSNGSGGGLSPSSWLYSLTGRGRKPVKNTMNFKEIHDLTALEEITFDNVLDCLVERYSLKEYYTFAGEMLISLNPCLHDSRKSLTSDQLKIQFQRHDEEGKCPHVFSVGKKSLRNLKTVGNNQVIVVSGNSGAGKTTATQQLLRYFIEHSQKLTEIRTPNSLDKKIYFATLILESLGNASTAINPNSSRFGRFVQLNYDGESGGQIVGAQIRTCLLEKHRVSKCSPLERNFHIFYYIFVSLEKGIFSPANFVDNIELGDEWRTLMPPYFKEAVRVSDEEQFLTLYQSLLSLKMTAELEKVFGIIFGIMVLLNIQFVPLEDQDQDNGDRENELHSNELKEFTIENVKAVETLADVFGVDGKELTDMLVARKITAGGGSRRRSIFRKPCQSVRECKERTAALTSHLYDALFHHVLARLNSMITTSTSQNRHSELDFDPNCKHLDQIRTISLLDLYGFERLENNQLEQLCINYANERLQKIQALRMRSHFNEMTNLEIDFEAVELDNVIQEFTERIDSLHGCVFQILNEECLLNRVTTSDKEVFDRLGMATTGNKYVQVGKPHDPDCPFIVRHYAMDVTYDLKGMIGKNTDNIPPEFNELFRNSSRLFLKSLITNLDNRGIEVHRAKQNGTEVLTQESKNTQSGSKSQREKTILQRFKVSVDGLMSELGNEDNQDLHFIRCIRPNNELAEGKVQRETVRQQLLSSGVVDIIRITGNGFPIRITKLKFCKDFPCIMKRCLGHTELDLIFPRVFSLNDSQIRFGKTQIFLTEKIWVFLLKIEHFILRRSAIVLQRNWRNHVKLTGESAAQDRLNLLIQELNELHINSGSFNNKSQNDTSPQEISSLLAPFGGGDSDISSEMLIQNVQNSPVKRGDKEMIFSPRITFASAIDKLKTVMSRLNLRYGDGIVSRGRVDKGPIHIYIKKTVLMYGHVIPKRLTSRGFMEAVPDYPDASENLSDWNVQGGGGDSY